jgi:pimeloyl-ACP methyl ester carboxylesterase
MRLHSQVIGHGPDLILLHGLFGSQRNWQPVARRLSGHFRVHTVDLRNHGASPHHDEVNYPLMAEDLQRFMDQERIAAAHVLGHSLGGKVAMQIALLRPHRVHRLTVVDIAPRAYEAVHDEVFAALRALDLSRLRTRTEADEALAECIPHHGTRRFLLTNLVFDPQHGPRWRIHLDALYAQREQLTSEVNGMVPFENPALFLRGGASDYFRDADWKATQQLFPSARLHTIAGAGHWVHVDAPEAFLSCVQEFLMETTD